MFNVIKFTRVLLQFFFPPPVCPFFNLCISRHVFGSMSYIFWGMLRVLGGILSAERQSKTIYTNSSSLLSHKIKYTQYFLIFLDNSQIKVMISKPSLPQIRFFNKS